MTQNVAHSPAPTPTPVLTHRQRVARVKAHGFVQGTRKERNDGECTTCETRIQTTKSWWIDGGGEHDDGWNGYCLGCAELRVVADEKMWDSYGEMGEEEFGRPKKDQPAGAKGALRPWSEYPVGSKAHAIGGGHWYRNGFGWKWNGPDGSGSTFPTPGADAYVVTAPGVEIIPV